MHRQRFDRQVEVVKERLEPDFGIAAEVGGQGFLPSRKAPVCGARQSLLSRAAGMTLCCLVLLTPQLKILPHRVAHTLPYSRKNLCHSQITRVHRRLSIYVRIVVMKSLCGL